MKKIIIVILSIVIAILSIIVYNIYVGAITGLVATVIEMLGAMVAFYRFNIKNVQGIK